VILLSLPKLVVIGFYLLRMNRCLCLILSTVYSIFERKVSFSFNPKKSEIFLNSPPSDTEFRLVIDPSGQPIKSPTVNCTPDLTRTPMKSAKRRSITLRAPSSELKAVWQNLLTRQIFLVNSTSINSPLESPDVLFAHPDLNLVANSSTSVKMSSIESIYCQNNQQVKIISC
jgi:hypothetical protein